MKLLVLAVCIFLVVSIDAHCSIECTLKYSPRCGHDGKTYSNECMLKHEACKQNKAIVQVAQEECNGCTILCNKMYAPVCGSDGKKYSNECMMRLTSCQEKKAIVIVKPASEKNTDCSKCDIMCTKVYQPVCGSDGKTHSNLCTMSLEACQTRTAIIAVHEKKC